MKSVFPVFLVVLTAIIGCGEKTTVIPEDEVVMSVNQSVFGQLPSGQNVNLFTCKNRNGLVLKMIDYGALVLSVEVPDRHGNIENVTLGFSDLKGYLDKNPFFGATVGRYCNRIGNASFSLDGKTFQLPNVMQLGSNRLSLSATGSLEGLAVQSARLEGDNGEADITGELQWQEVLAWQADLALRELSSNRFYPEYPVTVSGELSSSGQLVEGQPRVEIAFQEIKGVVNDYPLSAEGAASLDGKTINISELLVSAGDNRLQANGQVAELFDLVFELKADRLDQLMPGADGNLVASGTLEGNLDKP